MPAKDDSDSDESVVISRNPRRRRKLQPLPESDDNDEELQKIPEKPRKDQPSQTQELGVIAKVFNKMIAAGDNFITIDFENERFD